MRCSICYTEKNPCGFVDCPECGKQESEEVIEERGHCDDCEETEVADARDRQDPTSLLTPNKEANNG